jgi:hypothetical protein
MASKKKKSAKKKVSTAKKPVPKKARPVVAKRIAAKTKMKTKMKTKTVAAKKSPTEKRGAKKKIVAKKTAGAKRASTPTFRRRDGSGHLDPKYAKTLRAKSGARDDEASSAFIHNKARTKDDLAEQLAEEWVETATSGEDESQDVLGQVVSEETGGPFVTTTGREEFAKGVDASNPKSATREPFPKT